MDMTFAELMKNVTFADLLDKRGSLVVGGLMKLGMELNVAGKGREVSAKIFEILEGKPWLASAVALIFCLDTVLQNNPASTGAEGRDLINELEQKMKEGKLG
jgi:hypothetical protein